MRAASKVNFESVFPKMLSRAHETAALGWRSWCVCLYKNIYSLGDGLYAMRGWMISPSGGTNSGVMAVRLG